MKSTEATTCGLCGVTAVLTANDDPRVHKADCGRTNVTKEEA